MGKYRNFSFATYFVAQAAARVTREELEKQLLLTRCLGGGLLIRFMRRTEKRFLSW